MAGFTLQWAAELNGCDSDHVGPKIESVHWTSMVNVWWSLMVLMCEAQSQLRKNWKNTEKEEVTLGRNKALGCPSGA